MHIECIHLFGESIKKIFPEANSSLLVLASGNIFFVIRYSNNVAGTRFVMVIMQVMQLL